MKSDRDVAQLNISENADGVIFAIHVQPRASRTELCGVQGDALRLRLTSPPVDDAANRLCQEFLAKLLGVAKSRVTIIAGAKSRQKTVAVAGVGREAILALIT